MVNPILQMLNRNNGANNPLGFLNAINNPQAMFNNMMQSNPKFRDFVNQNQGRTPEQIAQAYGIDFNSVKALLK